jgi:hypothetical protein
MTKAAEDPLDAMYTAICVFSPLSTPLRKVGEHGERREQDLQTRRKLGHFAFPTQKGELGRAGNAGNKPSDHGEAVLFPSSPNDPPRGEQISHQKSKDYQGDKAPVPHVPHVPQEKDTTAEKSPRTHIEKNRELEKYQNFQWLAENLGNRGKTRGGFVQEG